MASPLWQSLLRGFLCKCPQCGVGKMYHSFTKNHSHCPSCKEELFHHQADDFPPYIVITIVGHIIVPLILYFSLRSEISEQLQIMIWVPITLLMTFLLMQPVKGAIIAYQWHFGMHGFEHSGK
jgi:uncharacterized protein (DUF983 family)